MKKNCQCAFTIDEWKENPHEAWQHGRMTRTRVTKQFRGVLEGTSVLESIMLRLGEQAEDPKAYVGIERIEGVLDGKTGSFILVHTSEALGKTYQQNLRILPGSGTMALAGITGKAVITQAHEFILDYELPGSSV